MTYWDVSANAYAEDPWEKREAAIAQSAEPEKLDLPLPKRRAVAVQAPETPPVESKEPREEHLCLECMKPLNRCICGLL